MLAALALLLVPLATVAQDTPVELLADPTGDVQIRGPDGANLLADPAGQPALDIVAAGVDREDPETLALYVAVDDLAAAATSPSLGGLTFTIDFSFGERGYRAYIQLPTGQPWDDVFDRNEPTAFLVEGRDDSAFRGAHRVEATVDTSGSRVIAAIPRALLLDHDQAPLARGRAITNVVVQALSSPNFQFGIPDGSGGSAARAGTPNWADRAPSDGDGPDYTMMTGVETQRGDLFTDVLDPVRWTNGEATTLSYSVRLSNRGAENQEASLRLAGVDPTWDVAHSEKLKLAPGESRNVTILVSIPFVHQHGKMHAFDAIFETDDGGMATARLGVYWPRIPQPAGHHDTVWFHGALLNAPQPPFDTVFAGGDGWFNAADSAVDDLDTGLAIPADASVPPGLLAAFGGDPEAFAFWRIPMLPELRIGLDFDLARLGSFTTSIDLPAPVNDAEVRMVLTLEERERGRGFFQQGNVDQIVLAEGNASFAGVQSGPLQVTMDLVPTPESDLIPHATFRDKSRNLIVQIIMTGLPMAGTGFTQHEAAQYTIDPAASSMMLPLFEYHESVDLAFTTDRSIELVVGERGQERSVNPGRSVVYLFTLDYRGAAADVFDLGLSGTNAEWGSILGDAQIRLEPGVPRTLALMVSAPDRAFAGDTADITLTATSTTNSAVQGGVRTLTRVVTDQDIPDEAEEGLILSGELTRPKETPGIGPMGLMGLLGVLAAVGRSSGRRR